MGGFVSIKSWAVAIIVIGFVGGLFGHYGVLSIYTSGLMFWVGIAWQKAWPIL
jgi:hypothetical protein